MGEKISRRAASKLVALGGAACVVDPRGLLKVESKMHKRTIPSSGELLPVIGLGTWQTFDVGSTQQERAPLREVLQILIKKGGSLIDSSPMYGRSEKVVGELTTTLGIKNQIFEATKVWTTGKNQGVDQINTSFDLLQADPIELLQVHNLQDWKTHLRTLQNLKDKQKIKYIGITHYHQGGYAEMEKIMINEEIDFIQVNYNLASRAANEKLLPLAREKGIGVIINRPYEGGVLFRKFKNRNLPDWAAEFDIKSWGQFFLKFILANPAVISVIPGTSKAKHMEDNTQAGFGAFPSKQHVEKMIQLIESV